MASTPLRRSPRCSTAIRTTKSSRRRHDLAPARPCWAFDRDLDSVPLPCEDPHMRPTCPHCGNTDMTTIEDNGRPLSHPDCTLLCVKPCAQDETSFDASEPIPEKDGTYVCGMQWDYQDQEA